jgi:hypothetical protein
MISKKWKCVIVSILVLSLLLIAIMYLGLNKENFASSMTSNDDTDDKEIYKNLKVTRVEGHARMNMNILPRHCKILVNIGTELDRDTRENFIFVFQTELSKVVRSFGNNAIIGQNSSTLNLKNETSGSTERLFTGYKITILDIINENASIANEIDNVSESDNIIEDSDTCIYVMTSRNMYKIEGVISSSITPYQNIKKIIKFLGIQTDY